MKLGEIIDTLEQFDPTVKVRFSDGSIPGVFMSWRGSYDQLTLAPADESDKLPTVGKLLAAAREADGRTFTGYKGGDFLMDRETPVWADDYSRSDHNIIAGVSVVDGEVVLNKVNVEEYVW